MGLALVLEAQVQALAKGLKHKHKDFLSEYFLDSGTETE